MKKVDAIEKKIYTLAELLKVVATWKNLNKTIAFTNGCFDILHEGHIFSLAQAAKEADYLIVGINSDNSIKKLKGANRPVNNEHSRSLLIANLVMVDAVIIFEEDTPQHLITSILPDVLVKGGDYTIEQIVGANEVIANGGRVVINAIVQGYSTTNTIEKIKNL
ncbi:MAG: D-glycero-beta-D-manno-heptose 1-phosphate adenylyltransferase [Chitinophagaceae bacterium]|nr:D-glycero-beta-D-manno-heptose 1-phosphate adenylyltransferase [Chitinophagaceae bacterium]MCW5905456.1 D-glycero-beta-D-manno-heptose 1-phosphate adenylyltransferase [Chitinophagaceae bacterium]